MKKVERESNYELLRIFSMILIVLCHILIHGHVLNNTTGVLNFVFTFIMCFAVMHVNLFMLITGYYQSKGKLKKEKVLSLILQVAFYNIVINSILKFTGLVEYTNLDFFKDIFFLNFQTYWFFSCYFIIYLISPFLNKLIDIIDKRTFKRLIMTLIICLSVFPCLTYNLFYAENGFTVLQFVMMYFIGAYIRKYEVNTNLMKNINVTQKRFILLILFSFTVLINFGLTYLSQYMMTLDSDILRYLASTIRNSLQVYNNPFIILQALFMFLLFGTFNFKSRFINGLSALTFGVYLIHESIFIRINLYKWLELDNGQMINDKSFLFKFILALIVIYFGCSLIEKVRQLIFYLFSKIGIVKKLRDKFLNAISNLVEFS